MNQNKNIQQIQNILRNIGLLTLTEQVRYGLSVLNYYTKNKKFILNNPNFKVPPQTLAYDAYSAPDWDFYKTSGEETALALFEMTRNYLQKNTLTHILEWGCGPARVLRHIHHSFGGEHTEIWGTDYNPESIKWCKNNIQNVNFKLNDLTPPLLFNDNYFEFIYSISVFTHLSEEVSYQWIAELFRITCPGGILVITTNGDSRKNIMLSNEIETYQASGVVIRGNYEEGKKMFFACHSEKYLREHLFKNFEILEYVNARFPHTGQDYWILRKPLQ